MSSDKRYNFSGSAVGFAANLHHFGEEPMFVDTCFEGSAALPPTGGCLRSESGPREVRHDKHGFLLCFESSSASAEGHRPGFSGRQEGSDPAAKPPVGPRVELTSRVTGLKVGINGLEVDELSSHLLAEDPRDPEDRNNKREIIFSQPKQPVLAGVRIAGRHLHVQFDDFLVNLPTQRDLIRELRKSGRFHDEYRHRFWKTHDDEFPLIHGYIPTTIVKSITFGDERLDKQLILGTNAVRLEDFGTIFFGELLVGASSRELSLIRLQLGSDAKGDGTAGYCSRPPDPNETPSH